MLFFERLKQENPTIDSMEFVVLDFETTGMNVAIDDIVELGAVRLSPGGQIASTFSSLVNPGRSIPSNVAAIHGITDKDVISAPDPESIVSSFIEFADNALLVAHNAKFDGLFLQKYLSGIFRKPASLLSNSGGQISNKEQWKGIAILDTITLSRSIFPGLDSYSLINLKYMWDIPSEREHRGLDDALVATNILLRCFDEMEIGYEKYSFRDLWKKATHSYILGKSSHGKMVNRKLDRLKTIFERAISEGREVKIIYSDSDGEKTERLIHPLRQFQSLTEFYVEAYCHLREAKRVFRIDRIKVL